MSSSPTIHVSSQIKEKLKEIKSAGGFSNTTDVLEHVLRVYHDNLARQNQVAPQPQVSKNKDKKKKRKQLLEWSDVKDNEEVVTYVTGLSKGARDWLWAKLEEKVCLFFVLSLLPSMVV